MEEEFIHSLSDEFNIHFIESDGKGRYPYANSMLIGDHLIDTGLSSNRMKSVMEKFKIKRVLLSHGHEDHIISNHMFDSSVEFMCHIKDKYLIEDIEKMIDHYALMNTPAENGLRQYFSNFQITNTKISETFEDNQLINIADNISADDLKCRIIHTPGHTEGHCAFYEEKSKIAFFADIDLTRFVFYGGVDSSVIEMVESIEKLKKLDIDIAVTSHHNKIFKGREINEKLDEFHLVIKKRDDRILSRFSETKPINIDDLFKQNLIYRKYSEYEGEYEYISEKIMVQKHIDKFLKEKKIIQENNGYILT